MNDISMRTALALKGLRDERLTLAALLLALAEDEKEEELLVKKLSVIATSYKRHKDKRVNTITENVCIMAQDVLPVIEQVHARAKSN